jgi:putative peptidoglycan lipid II flippase
MSQVKAARAATIVMLGILASRLLGFVRERAVADIFGRSAATDAYYAAFAIPDLMYYLLIGGALSSAFIPVFTEYLAKGEEKEAWYVASTFINVAILVLLVLTGVGILFAPALAPLVAYRFHGEQLNLLVRLMRVMFPAVFFTALAGLQGGGHDAAVDVGDHEVVRRQLVVGDAAWLDHDEPLVSRDRARVAE